MDGFNYAAQVADYIVTKCGERGVEVYRELTFGKTLVGKTRKIDVFILEASTGRACAIECKFQQVAGTVDEKIPFALQNMEVLPIPGFIVYGGPGFSSAILHLLEASRLAVRFMLPDDTWQLDHALAAVFGWWDLVIQTRPPIGPDEPYRLRRKRR